MTDAEKQIREALAAGPTGGQWIVDIRSGCAGVKSVANDDGFPGMGEDYPSNLIAYTKRGAVKISEPYAHWKLGRGTEETMRYIAACNPANIAALLAELDALRHDNARLVAQCAENEADARRYRWLVSARSVADLAPFADKKGPPPAKPQDQILSEMASMYFVKGDADHLIDAAINASEGENE